MKGDTDFGSNSMHVELVTHQIRGKRSSKRYLGYDHLCQVLVVNGCTVRVCKADVDQLTREPAAAPMMYFILIFSPSSNIATINLSSPSFKLSDNPTSQQDLSMLIPSSP